MVKGVWAPPYTSSGRMTMREAVKWLAEEFGGEQAAVVHTMQTAATIVIEHERRREGAHDDLVLAVALGLYVGKKRASS